MARSILAANGIPYFVHNEGYSSLYPGIQMHLFNVPTIMVPPSAVETAKELLNAYLPEVQVHLRPKAERSPWHIVRMLVEAMCCVWFVPRIGDPGERNDEGNASC
jgi:Putative prokaryotic signal transducing protein